VQTGAPLEHTTDAEVAQGLVEVHAAPCEQAVQALALPGQTPPVQAVPAAS